MKQEGKYQDMVLSCNGQNERSIEETMSLNTMPYELVYRCH